MQFETTAKENELEEKILEVFEKAKVNGKPIKVSKTYKLSPTGIGMGVDLVLRLSDEKTSKHITTISFDITDYEAW